MEREAELDRELERRRGLEHRERLLREREWERERERGGFLRDRPRGRDWDRPPRYAREPLGLQMDRDDHEKAEVDWYVAASTPCIMFFSCCSCLTLPRVEPPVPMPILPDDTRNLGYAGERSGQEDWWSLATRVAPWTRTWNESSLVQMMRGEPLSSVHDALSGVALQNFPALLKVCSDKRMSWAGVTQTL